MILTCVSAKEVSIIKKTFSMKVLMVGATGEFAGLVLPELVKCGIKVRALVRNEQKAAIAKKRGAHETIIGDLDQPDSLLAAASGMDGVFHINPAFAANEGEQGVAMVNAAAEAGVSKFVFSAVYHPSLSMINHKAKRPVERELYHSGLNFTILQPASFMQNIEAAWPAILKTGKFVQPYSSTSKMSYVDYRDVAEAVAIAFSSNKLDYGTFELCAKGMWSRAEVAGLMTEAAGRKIEAAEIPFEEWAKRANVPDGPMWNGLKAMFAEYDKYGFHGGNSLVLKTILGREPRTLAAYLQELAAKLAEMVPG
jgi:uncharacterized protein YbjT (DUF2867 family)